MKTEFRLTFVLLAALALAACGGGSSGGGADDDLAVLTGGTPGGGVGGSTGGGGTTPPPPDPGEDLAIRLLKSGSGSGYTTLTRAVARNQAELDAIWIVHFPPWPPGIGAPVEAPPQVDWATEIVLAVFIGSRPTGGYAVSSISATRQGDGVDFVYEETQPGTNCVVAQFMSTPFLFVAIPRVTGSVAFQGTVRVVNCP